MNRWYECEAKPGKIRLILLIRSVCLFKKLTVFPPIYWHRDQLGRSGFRSFQLLGQPAVRSFWLFSGHSSPCKQNKFWKEKCTKQFADCCQLPKKLPINLVGLSGNRNKIGKGDVQNKYNPRLQRSVTASNTLWLPSRYYLPLRI
jgi:hypothetical protein